METRCGVVKVSLLEIILEDDGVTMELPPIVLRFLSVRTVLPELLDLFLPVGAVAVMEGSGNLTTIGTLKFRTGSRQECTYLDTEETLFPEDIPAVEALDWRGAMFTDCAFSWLARTLFGGSTPGLVPRDLRIFKAQFIFCNE